MRVKAPVDRRSEPGYAAWHQPSFGPCAACGIPDRLIGHHVILAQHVRALDPGLVWALANRLQLGSGARCGCHSRHHAAVARLPLSIIPDAALAFASDLLGEAGAADYLARHYAP